MANSIMIILASGIDWFWHINRESRDAVTKKGFYSLHSMKLANKWERMRVLNEVIIIHTHISCSDIIALIWNGRIDRSPEYMEAPSTSEEYVQPVDTDAHRLLINLLEWSNSFLPKNRHGVFWRSQCEFLQSPLWFRTVNLEKHSGNY